MNWFVQERQKWIVYKIDTFETKFEREEEDNNGYMTNQILKDLITLLYLRK